MLRERIVAARELQDKLKSFAADAEPPALVLSADDDSLSIRGNEAGLLRFAAELIEIASGGQVSPSASEWLAADELPLQAIVLGPHPKREVLRPTFFGKVKAYTFFGIVLFILLVGLGEGWLTILDWIEHHLHF